MKRWVVDTNVVVSGLMTAKGPCALILESVMDGRIKLVYDARILAEYRDVLCRPRLKLNPVHVMHFLQALGGQMSVVPERLVAVGPDPDDLAFIEGALAVPDRTIVTGNLADFPREILNGARLLTPAQAVAELSH
jgi:putative PIN family toxin of toxin-antitoxin system